MGLIYQSIVETAADPSAQINFRQSSHVIHETLVFRQPHRTKDRTLINVAAENNHHLNITPLKHPGLETLPLEYCKADVKPPSFISSWCKAALTQFALLKALYK